jgi:DNA-directed RNA polymerase subunit RPC12/RpoP
VQRFESGVMAGAGSFSCAVCGFAVSLRSSDALPECPGCGGRRFERAPMFGATLEVPAPLGDASSADVGPPPGWLVQARSEIACAGDYLVFDSGTEIETVELEEGWTRIGRSLSAEIRIDDPTVSRRHALIHRDGDTVRLLDDRSLNGVFRNGRRVELDELQDGDTLAVGRFQLHYLHLTGTREPALANA